MDSVLALMRVYSKDPLVQAEICRLVMDLAATGPSLPSQPLLQSFALTLSCSTEPGQDQGGGRHPVGRADHADPHEGAQRANLGQRRPAQARHRSYAYPA